MESHQTRFNRLLKTEMLKVDEETNSSEAEELDSKFNLLSDDTVTVSEDVFKMDSLINSLEEARQLGFPKQQLIDISGRLVQIETSFPSMEAFELFAENSVDVSLETLQQSIREALRAILTMLAKFWAQLTDFAYEITHTTLAVKTRLSLSKSKLREQQRPAPLGRKVDITRYVSQLSCDKLVADNPTHLLHNLSQLEHQLSLVRRQYVPMVLELSQELVDRFQQWGNETPAQWLFHMNTVASRFNPAATLNIHSTHADEGKKTGDQLPGYRAVIYVEGTTPYDHHTAESSGKEIEWAQYYQQRTVSLELMISERDSRKYETAIWPQHLLEKIHVQIEHLVSEIERCSRDDARRALRNLSLKLDHMSRQQIDIPDGSASYFHAGLGYVRAISKWTKEPYMALIVRALTVANSAVRLSNLHIRAYSEPSNTKES